jgi:hypothetical protein
MSILWSSPRYRRALGGREKTEALYRGTKNPTLRARNGTPRQDSRIHKGLRWKELLSSEILEICADLLLVVPRDARASRFELFIPSC